MNAADRVIRISTAAAVLGVAAIAAYVSYQHAFEVVRAHGESGLTARLEPATIDGLVYASSMVILYAARHRLPVPALARWLLALGILATLAANVAHGWPNGPVGAVVAAWPAASLVGSYELLLWLIRTSATAVVAREPTAVHQDEPADHSPTELRLVRTPDLSTAEGQEVADQHMTFGDPNGCRLARSNGASRTNEPARTTPSRALRYADQVTTGPLPAAGSLAAKETDAVSEDAHADADVAAVAAYRASVAAGTPLSERKLAIMFGKTSRRWARNRMAEARGTMAP